MKAQSIIRMKKNLEKQQEGTPSSTNTASATGNMTTRWLTGAPGENSSTNSSENTPHCCSSESSWGLQSANGQDYLYEPPGYSVTQKDTNDIFGDVSLNNMAVNGATSWTISLVLHVVNLHQWNYRLFQSTLNQMMY